MTAPAGGHGGPASRRGGALLRSPLLIARRRARLGTRWALRAALDARDRLSGRRDPLVPPRRLGMPSQLRAVGERIVDHALIEAGGLRPDERVLDVGCGPGRVAVPLTRYLDPQRGSYEGFDVLEPAIDWVASNITPRHPNFRFRLADVGNREYNPGGSADAADYRFPYPDRDFDLAFAMSLYTHMLPYQVANYLRQTARTLRPGARSVATFFLLNAESEGLLTGGIDLPAMAGGGRLELGDDLDDGHGGRFRAHKPDRPEARILLYEEDVRRLHAEAGLEIREVLPGSWCGRPRRAGDIGQDVVVAVRSA